LSWKLYTTAKSSGTGGYSWAICPSIAKCLYTSQRQNQVDRTQLFTDASNGTLPNFSVVLPDSTRSQHNQQSMQVGDNWIGQVVQAIEGSPNWSSTAIFITYDDCGCFYDHVPPPSSSLGIREPMVIVSPYARPGYTDSATASFASLLAFTEHAFGLPALNGVDGSAYDYADSFDFNQTPVAPVTLKRTPISRAERRRIPAPPEGYEGGT
jgi:phospholipase C